MIILFFYFLYIKMHRNSKSGCLSNNRISYNRLTKSKTKNYNMFEENKINNYKLYDVSVSNVEKKRLNNRNNKYKITDEDYF